MAQHLYLYNMTSRWQQSVALNNSTIHSKYNQLLSDYYYNVCV